MLIAVAWLFTEPDFEPALTSLVLLATIVTLFVDHWLAERERRRELLSSVVHELYIDCNVLNDPLFASDNSASQLTVVFPRLSTGAVVHAIASGAFTTARDSRLFKLLQNWRESAEDFNHRLDITELCIFVVRKPEEIQAFRLKLSHGRVSIAVRRAGQELSDLLLERYASESSITRDTVLFPGEDGVN